MPTKLPPSTDRGIRRSVPGEELPPLCVETLLETICLPGAFKHHQKNKETYKSNHLVTGHVPPIVKTTSLLVLTTVILEIGAELGIC